MKPQCRSQKSFTYLSKNPIPQQVILGIKSFLQTSHLHPYWPSPLAAIHPPGRLVNTCLITVFLSQGICEGHVILPHPTGLLSLKVQAYLFNILTANLPQQAETECPTIRLIPVYPSGHVKGLLSSRANLLFLDQTFLTSMVHTQVASWDRLSV